MKEGRNRKFIGKIIGDNMKMSVLWFKRKIKIIGRKKKKKKRERADL